MDNMFQSNLSGLRSSHHGPFTGNPSPPKENNPPSESYSGSIFSSDTTGATASTSPTTSTYNMSSTANSSTPPTATHAASSSTLPSQSSITTSTSSHYSTTSSKSSSSLTATSSKSNAGAIAGGVIGGVVFIGCVAVGLILFCRYRARKRTAPSSEFMRNEDRTVTPIFRLDSNAPNAVAQAHNASGVPLPLRQDPYYTGPVLSDMKFPEVMTSSQPSRPSIDKSPYIVQYPETDGYGSYTYPPQFSTPIGEGNEGWSEEKGGYGAGIRSISPAGLPIAEEHHPQGSPYQPFLQNSYPVLWQMANPAAMDLVPQRRSVTVRRSAEVPSRTSFRPISQSDDFSRT
ncbi:hypothetical protein BJ138DRAFT_815376 [Hygrophoropsis aurantiaca]|uniref:Uncharacterized protein n=1 Tax=Hygrophoropsis aurantiaca TaxID=72124 RepID=A0ACB8AG85_9AGAM|nr:hypothetical protein BJ138DRAFT_815376 [Hygrophoropsis aurantiaca]